MSAEIRGPPELWLHASLLCFGLLVALPIEVEEEEEKRPHVSSQAKRQHPWEAAITVDNVHIVTDNNQELDLHGKGKKRWKDD